MGDLNIPDDYTAKLIREATANEWSLTSTADYDSMIYYLERHGKPRFKAKLKGVKYQRRDCR